MAVIGKVLEVIRTQVGGVQVTQIKVDLGSGDTRQCRSLFLPPGIDAAPVVGDFAILSATHTTGRFECHGFFDPTNADISDNGAVRLYSRNSGGAAVAEVRVNTDGGVRIFNGFGSIELKADGTVDINGATIGTDGSITSPVSFTAPSAIINGKELAEHTHNHGDPVTGPNN